MNTHFGWGGDEPKKLRAGDMLYLAIGEPHALEAVEDSSFLLTIVRTSAGDHL